MRRCKGFILLIFIITGSANLFSQGEIVLKVEPDTNIIRIGEQFNLNVSLKHPDNINISFPLIPDIIDPRLEILESSSIDTLSSNNKTISVQQKFVMTSFDTGYYQIPPLPFKISFGNKIDTLFSRSVPLMVLTMPLDTSNNIFDIKSQYGMKYNMSEFINSPYPWIILGLLIISLVILYFKKRPKEKSIFTPRKPDIPAHVVALRELDALKAEKLWQQNKIKEYYTRLTEIIRNYIELRFGVMALEQTSTEIIAEFQENKLIDNNSIEHLQDLLSLADLIKFAKGTALPDENEKNMESAYDFVRKTKIVHTIQTVNSQNKIETTDVEPVKELKNDA